MKALLRNPKVLVLTGILLTLASAVALFAAVQDFAVVNKTGFTITSLHASPIKDRSWGDDILGDDELLNGEELEIKFTGYGNLCRFDLMLTDTKDIEWIVEDINLCDVHSVTFTKKGGAVHWEAN